MAEIFTLFPQVIYKSKLQNHKNLKERLADDLIKKFKANPNQSFDWADLCDSWQEDATPYIDVIATELYPHIKQFLYHFEFPEFRYKLDSWFNVHTNNMYQETHAHMHGPTVLCGIYYMQLSSKDNPVIFKPHSEMYSSHLRIMNLNPSHPLFAESSLEVLNIKEGDLLLFTPDSKHLVPRSKEKHDGYRISLSFNLQKTF